MYHVMSEGADTFEIEYRRNFVDDLTGGHHNKCDVPKLYIWKLVP